MYDGFTGINFEATLRKNKISTAPINVNRTIFSINIRPIGIHFLQLKDKRAHVSINVNRRTWKFNMHNERKIGRLIWIK